MLPPSDNPFVHFEDIGSSVMAPRKAGTKKARQWARWHDEVIPAMLDPYFTYLASHQPTHLPYGPCSCGNSHDLSLLVVYLDSLYFPHLLYF